MNSKWPFSVSSIALAMGTVLLSLCNQCKSKSLNIEGAWISKSGDTILFRSDVIEAGEKSNYKVSEDSILTLFTDSTLESPYKILRCDDSLILKGMLWTNDSSLLIRIIEQDK